MSWILYALAGYDPDKDARGPLKEQKKRTQTQTDTEKLPENVRPNAITKWLEQYYTEEDSLVWQNLNANKLNLKDGRNPIITEAEVHYIQELQSDWEYLNVKKAVELKLFWAIGDSAKECAAAHRGKRGYSKATCDKYWRLFFKYHSPIE